MPRLLKTNLPDGPARAGDSRRPAAARALAGACGWPSPHFLAVDRAALGQPWVARRARANAGLQLDDPHAAAARDKRRFTPTRSSGKAMADREAEIVARIAPGVARLDAARSGTGWPARRPVPQPRLPVRCSKNRAASARAPAGRPLPILVEDEAAHLIAAAPAYLKTHSQGEYVFDHGWADAWERAGGHYYPKLQVAVPFTPVPGPRLLGRRPQHAARRAGDGDGPERPVVGAHHLPRRGRRGRARARAAG